MGYKILEKENDIYFKYAPKKMHKKNLTNQKKKESPFRILKTLNLN